MFKKFLKSSVIIFVCTALAYAPLPRAEQLSLSSSDVVAPELTPETYVQSVAPASDHTIKVKVTDDVGIKQVTLYYRDIGKTEHERSTMQKIEKTDCDMATVGADEIKPAGIENYLQAVDLADNTGLHGYSFSPLSVKIDTAATQPDLAGNTLSVALEPKTDEAKKGIGKWVWIGLGVLVAGIAAAAIGSDDEPTTGTLTITGTTP